MNKLFLMLASIFGALAVIAGAMLAHKLKPRMPDSALEIYDTAVRYQVYHVFALITAGILSEKFLGSLITLAGICFIAGIILFSGSLYIISVLLTIGSPVPLVLGILTPIGGFGFILGWIFLAMAVGRGRST
ncbi:MAG TPA: DUF423 domain-containing protein [Puia sp.]|nr:DUF423 domain-containing protein [Puia sp.]